MRRRSQQVEKARFRGRPPVFLRRPSQRLQQDRRVEDVANPRLRPVVLDQPDDDHVVEGAITRGLIVDEMHVRAIAPLIRCEGAPFDRTAHGAGELGKSPFGIVVGGVRGSQPIDEVHERGAGPLLARRERIVRLERNQEVRDKRSQPLEQL